MTAWAYLIIVVVLGGFMLISVRNRKRQAAADFERISRIEVGAEVMTTSGLYGRIVAKRDDGTVTLAIAPGIEVKWALAALRDADSLDSTYRRGLVTEDRSATDSDGTAAASQLPAHDQHPAS